MLNNSTDINSSKNINFHFWWKGMLLGVLLISNIYRSQIYVKDSALVFVENGASVIDKTELSQNDLQKTKIYVGKNTTITNVSEFKNYDLVYLNKELKIVAPTKISQKETKFVKAKEISSRVKTKTDKRVILKDNTPLHEFYNTIGFGVNDGILVNINPTPSKSGTSCEFYLDFQYIIQKVLRVIIADNQRKKIQLYNSFIARPPPGCIL